MMSESGWRVAVITTVPPIAQALTAFLREKGHQPVAVLSARRPQRAAPGRLMLTDENAPRGLDLLLPARPASIEPLLRAVSPDLVLTFAFPWKIPQAALDVPRLGAVNCHPALLPRHRGPIPMAWAIRDGDATFGVTWHRMDSELDTGPILAQATVPMEADDFGVEQVGPRFGQVALELLPHVLERVAARDPGDPQADGDERWAGYFGEDYATIDWSRPARSIHDQVRAWGFAMGNPMVSGPIAMVDGRRMRLTRTSLHDPGGTGRRIQAGDGPIWIVDAEPID
jgi:methionyl-tRNA formyltransferase